MLSDIFSLMVSAESKYLEILLILFEFNVNNLIKTDTNIDYYYVFLLISPDVQAKQRINRKGKGQFATNFLKLCVKADTAPDEDTINRRTNPISWSGFLANEQVHRDSNRKLTYATSSTLAKYYQTEAEKLVLENQATNN